MSTPERGDRDLESLLRRALHEQAERVQPLGDGLAKIQQRAAVRRRRRTWLRPTLAALAAAVAVVGALGVPALLHRSQSSDLAGSPPSHSRPVTPSATDTHDSTTRSGYVPAWPYLNTGEALRGTSPTGPQDARQSPETLATSFVYSFVSTVSLGVSTPVKLAAKAPQKKSGSDLTVDVVRPDLGRAVCQVRLTRLAGSPAGYVVTGASTGDLTVRATSEAQGALMLHVGGTYRPVATSTATQLWSAFIVPDGTTTPALLAPTTDDPTPRWSRILNLPNRASGPGIVAAWTVDADGNVLDFAAVGAR